MADNHLKQVTPALAAIYQTGYRTPAISGAWGDWRDDAHDPEKKLPNGEPDIASVYMPVIGPYDSTDPDLCEYHILLAKAAGLDAFMLDWPGTSASATAASHQGVTTMLAAAEGLDFKVALALNGQASFGEGIPAPVQAVNAAVASLEYARDQFIQSPAYFRVQGMPLVALLPPQAPGQAAAWLNAEAWQAALARLTPPLCLVAGWSGNDTGLDFPSWMSVFPWPAAEDDGPELNDAFWGKCRQAEGKRRFAFMSGLVRAGFDNRGVAREHPKVRSRQLGATYSASWEDNLRNSARVMMISTWNHFRDGSLIEPVKEIVLHKQAAAPGWGYRELLTTREYAARFTRRKLWPLPALFLPERLYRLRKSGGPAHRGDRIRLFLIEGDIESATLGLEHAGV